MKRLFQSNKSLNNQIIALILSTFVPMLAVSLGILIMLLVQFSQFTAINDSIVKASSFSRDFKDDVDLKMYYFVSGSSDELPFDEIETARNLAQDLTDHTRNAESMRSLHNILNLCDSLRESIDKIQETEGYDNRMEQLETNIYVITELVQDQIYLYLFHEAGELAALQERQRALLIPEVIGICLILSVIASISIQHALRIGRSVTGPIDALSGRVKEIGRGDLMERPPVEADDERLKLLGDGIEEMVRKLSAQIELNKQEQEKLRGIELALLQAQINPHFLYNTLDAIVWLIEISQDEAAEKMVTSLSTYFRSFLSNGKDIITLEEEITHVRSYLEIQQVRYKDRLEYVIETIPEAAFCQIPKLTLQPIVENAIYHGIKPKRGKGLITIECKVLEASVLVSVRDTGLGMTREALDQLVNRIMTGETTGFGLIAAYKRLKLLYGDTFRFEISSEPDVGTEISLLIPFDNATETEAAHE